MPGQVEWSGRGANANLVDCVATTKWRRVSREHTDHDLRRVGLQAKHGPWVDVMKCRQIKSTACSLSNNCACLGLCNPRDQERTHSQLVPFSLIRQGRIWMSPSARWAVISTARRVSVELSSTLVYRVSPSVSGSLCQPQFSWGQGTKCSSTRQYHHRVGWIVQRVASGFHLWEASDVACADRCCIIACSCTDVKCPVLIKCCRAPLVTPALVSPSAGIWRCVDAGASLGCRVGHDRPLDCAPRVLSRARCALAQHLVQRFRVDDCGFAWRHQCCDKGKRAGLVAHRHVSNHDVRQHHLRSHSTSATTRLRARVSPASVLDTFLWSLGLRHEIGLTFTVRRGSEVWLADERSSRKRALVGFEVSTSTQSFSRALPFSGCAQHQIVDVQHYAWVQYSGSGSHCTNRRVGSYFRWQLLLLRTIHHGAAFFEDRNTISRLSSYITAWRHACKNKNMNNMYSCKITDMQKQTHELNDTC